MRSTQPAGQPITCTSSETPGTVAYRQQRAATANYAGPGVARGDKVTVIDAFARELGTAYYVRVQDKGTAWMTAGQLNFQS